MDRFYRQRCATTACGRRWKDLDRRLHTLETRSRHDRTKMRLLEKHLGIRLRDDLGEVQEWTDEEPDDA